ncbi:hypothetical protein D3C77_748690 [compost metagenome]
MKAVPESENRLPLRRSAKKGNVPMPRWNSRIGKRYSAEKSPTVLPAVEANG